MATLSWSKFHRDRRSVILTRIGTLVLGTHRFIATRIIILIVIVAVLISPLLVVFIVCLVTVLLPLYSVPIATGPDRRRGVGVRDCHAVLRPSIVVLGIGRCSSCCQRWSPTRQLRRRGSLRRCRSPYRSAGSRRGSGTGSGTVWLISHRSSTTTAAATATSDILSLVVVAFILDETAGCSRRGHYVTCYPPRAGRSAPNVIGDALSGAQKPLADRRARLEALQRCVSSYLKEIRFS